MPITKKELTREEKLSQYTRGLLNSSIWTIDILKKQVLWSYEQFCNGDFTQNEILEELWSDAEIITISDVPDSIS